MLYSYISYIIKMHYILFICKFSTHLTLLSCLYIFVWGKVVKHYNHFFFIKNFTCSSIIKLWYRNCCGNIISHNYI